jgi:hypothetical protein
MTAFSLSPAFVVVNYHSPFAPHKMTLPTLAWSSLGGTHGEGGYTAWDEVTNRDADDMIKDLVTALADVMPDDTTFDDYIIYTKADAHAANIPQRAGPLAITGTLTGAYPPATQATWSFRTAAFNHFKLVTLDTQPPSDFARIEAADWSVDQNAVRTQLESDGNAWAARDGTQIATAIRITFTLNEKLRRAYRLT